MREVAWIAPMDSLIEADTSARSARVDRADETGAAGQDWTQAL